jgi:hypothetical protein
MSFLQKVKESIKSSIFIRNFFLRRDLLQYQLEAMKAESNPKTLQLKRDLLERQIRHIDHQISIGHIQQREKYVEERENQIKTKLAEIDFREESLHQRERELGTPEDRQRNLDERASAIAQLEKRLTYLMERFLNPRSIGFECRDAVTAPQDILRLESFFPHPQNRNLCFFAHYDIHGVVDPWVLGYLEQIRRNGFDTILITTSPRIDEVSLKSLSGICRTVIHRKNEGLDFGSWRCAYHWLGTGIQDYDQLLLVNDSVFGPIRDLSETFQRIEKSPADLIGMTDSWEIQYHLQSYFLYFKASILRSTAFEDFWNQVSVIKDKQSIIDHFELGTTQFFMAQGFQVEALYDFYQIRDRWLETEGTPADFVEKFQNTPLVGMNPTIDLWEVLLRDFKFPFLKGELLKANPRKSTRILFWRQYLKNHDPLLKQIDQFLKRTRNGSVAI